MWSIFIIGPDLSSSHAHHYLRGGVHVHALGGRQITGRPLRWCSQRCWRFRPLPSRQPSSSPDLEPNNSEITFGCDPGPVQEFHHADPTVPPRRVGSRSDALQYATLAVRTTDGHAVQGHGFNLEHTLWSCPGLPTRPRTLAPDAVPAGHRPRRLRAASVRSARTPPASALNRDHLPGDDGRPEVPAGWAMLRRLNRENVRLMLGVWGGPGQFTDDGTRRGSCCPSTSTPTSSTSRRSSSTWSSGSRITIWAVTVANEPDGGDGTGDPAGPATSRSPVSSGRASPRTASSCTGRTRPRPRTPCRTCGASSTTRTRSNGSAPSPPTSTSPTMRWPAWSGRFAPSAPACRSTSPSTPASASVRWTGARRRRNEIGQMLDSLQMYASVMNARRRRRDLLGRRRLLPGRARGDHALGPAPGPRRGVRAPDALLRLSSRSCRTSRPGSTILPIELAGPGSARRAGGRRRIAPARRPDDRRDQSGRPDRADDRPDGPAPQQFEVWVTDPTREMRAHRARHASKTAGSS